MNEIRWMGGRVGTNVGTDSVRLAYVGNLFRRLGTSMQARTITPNQLSRFVVARATTPASGSAARGGRRGFLIAQAIGVGGEWWPGPPPEAAVGRFYGPAPPTR